MLPLSWLIALAAATPPAQPPSVVRAPPFAPEPSRPFDVPPIRIASPAERWPDRTAGAPVSAPDWSDYRLYPQAALALDQEGRVEVEALIGSDGVPSACRVRRTSGYAELDQGTCNLMNLLRFAPTRDGESRPLQSVYRRTFLWLLSDPTPFATTQVTADISVVGGTVAGCTLRRHGEAPPEWTKLACRNIASELDYYLGTRRLGARRARIVVEVVPTGSTAPASRETLPEPAAEWRSEFGLAPNGDIRDCRKLVDRGFGPPTANQQSPCGFFLTRTWFAPVDPAVGPATGIFELRVYVLD